MAPEPYLRRLAGALAAAAAACALAAAPAEALRIVNYNIMNYPSVNVSGRNPHIRTVLQPLAADVFVVQEMQSQAGVDSIRLNVLNVIEPGQWAAAPFYNGPDTDNALFYRTSTVQVLGSWAWQPPDSLRYVAVYRLKPVGYSAASTELRVYSLHLKAGNTSTDRARRLTDAIGIRDSMNAMPAGTHAILLGDFNIYGGDELPFAKFLESQLNNTGRLYDPLNAPLSLWQDQPGLAWLHTQSPCLTCPSGSYASGGLDDRFDMFLPTYNMGDGEGLDLLTSTYVSVGNDAQHLNKTITDAPTIPEGAAYATALWNASDHLPVRVDVQLPPKITATPALAFGTVIVGGPASQNLSITNPASPPADELDYSFTPPAEFSAPGGSFQLNAGAPAALHAIGMSTTTAGNKAGTLVIPSDAPESPTTNVGLSGTVLDHAVASLDSVVVSLSDSLDFGDHVGGGFTDRTTRVHNRGYHALQARLSVSAGVITGGAGRFSLVGGFSPALLAGTGQDYTVHFDDTGATQDSTYFATLTFTSADEALPGAAAQPDLALTLRARRVGSVVAVGDRPFVPGVTRLHAPYPNPLSGATTLRLDLARAADVRIEVFDLGGRRVAVVASRTLDAGRHTFSWSGRAADGAALGAGLYFVRLSGTGLKAQSARLAIVR